MNPTFLVHLTQPALRPERLHGKPLRPLYLEVRTERFVRLVDAEACAQEAFQAGLVARIAVEFLEVGS